MRKKDIKRKISESFDAQNPNLRSKILDSCKNEAQLPEIEEQNEPMRERRFNFNFAMKRIVAVAVCLMIFISGFSVGFFIPNGTNTNEEAETFVYLDVNPSIELSIDKSSKIVDCIAVNEDAEEILSDLKLRGVDMNTALTAIIGSMYVNGYLTEDSNSILISVDSNDKEKENTLLTDITAKVNSVFEKSELECSIIAQSVQVDETLKKRAEDNGVSVGKMHLVDEMVSGIEELEEKDVTDLAEMSIKELNLIYSTRPGKGEDNDPFGDNVSKGEVGGFINQKDAFSLLLESMEVEEDDVEWHKVKTTSSKENNLRKMVYVISLRLEGDDTVYNFEINCQSGDIKELPADALDTEKVPPSEKDEDEDEKDFADDNDKEHKFTDAISKEEDREENEKENAHPVFSDKWQDEPGKATNILDVIPMPRPEGEEKGSDSPEHPEDNRESSVDNANKLPNEFIFEEQD